MTRERKQTKNQGTVSAGPSSEQIASRAYEKWQKRGCPCGDDLRDWFEAEAELGAEKEPNPPRQANSES
jgi:hypothetical protein